MLASPEAARFVLVTQSHLFKPTYPKSKERLIGPCALFFHQGEYHLRLRKLIQRSLSLDSLRNLVPEIEALAVSTIKSWGDDGCMINTFKEMKKVGYIISYNLFIASFFFFFFFLYMITCMILNCGCSHIGVAIFDIAKTSLKCD